MNHDCWLSLVVLFVCWLVINAWCLLSVVCGFLSGACCVLLEMFGLLFVVRCLLEIVLFATC